jgi:hypothetical protein
MNYEAKFKAYKCQCGGATGVFEDGHPIGHMKDCLIADVERDSYKRGRADEAKEREAEIKFTPEEIKLVIHACKFIARATTDDYTARWEQLAKRISELKGTTKGRK